jgi:RNA-directed DNA polymerase
MLNILQPIFEPAFHPSSYGYRPGGSCQKAVAKAERFMNRYGLEHVVDMDLSKCFDRLDHEQIIKSVNRKVSDGKVLKLIRQFLKTGIMKEGKYEVTEVGSPRGARKNLQIAKEILEDELKLTINEKKTKITQVNKGVEYLGFIIRERTISINPKRIKRFKDKIRELTPRNHGMNVESMIKRLNPVIRGWANYFRIAKCKKLFQRLAEWIRRRLRMKQMKEWKSWKPLFKTLRRNGYTGEYKKISMTRWRNSVSPLIHRAIPNKWFDDNGLINLGTYDTGILSHYYE